MIYYQPILLIKPRIFNFSIDSSSLNIFSSLLPHFSQIIERTNILSKIFDILGFSNFLYSLRLMRYIFLNATFLESIYKINF